MRDEQTERLEGIADEAAQRLVANRPIVGFALLVYDNDGCFSFVTNDSHSRAAEALLRTVLVRIGETATRRGGA